MLVKKNPRSRRRLALLLFVALIGGIVVLYWRTQGKLAEVEGKLAEAERKLAEAQTRARPAEGVAPPMGSGVVKILYVVTSLTEFETGSRGTERGANRFLQKILPTIQAVVTSLFTSPEYSVDLQLICAYNLTSTAHAALRDTLPPQVRIDVWNDAMPRRKSDGQKMRPVSLARQHRLVVAKRLHDYDFFSCWEDDMYAGRQSVDYFRTLTKQLDTLARLAPPETTSFDEDTDKPISRAQFNQMVPGFIRVEWLRAKLGLIECCNFTKQELMVWESKPESYRLRELEGVGIAGFLPIADQRWREAVGATLVAEKPSMQGQAKIFSQQGGWMASREQIKHFDSRCKGGFLPPFSLRDEKEEEAKTVEYWSGGHQLFARACQFQRVIPMSENGFQSALMYHTSNNKQNTIEKARRLDAKALRRDVLEVYKAKKMP